MAYNFTSPSVYGYGSIPCNYTVASVFQDSFRICAPYVDAFQTCPVSTISQETKLTLANETSWCLAAVWAYDPAPQLLINYTSAVPPTIEANASCRYPDFEPIVQQACAFEFSRLNITCGEADNYTELYSPNVAEVDYFIKCQTSAIEQYWRCTQQKPYDEIASCVIQNAPKVGWLGTLLVYEGAPSCETAIYWIVSQALTVGVGLLISFLIAYAGIPTQYLLKPFWSWFKGLFCRGKGKDEASDTGPPSADEQNWKSNWQIEDRYAFKANDLVASLGGDILAIFIAITLLQKSGVSAVISKETTMWDMFVFLAIRPRAAPLTGILGFWKGWSSAALADLIGDGILSFIAGVSVAIRYYQYVYLPPLNPIAPAYALKILGVGAIMTGLPSVLALCLSFLIALVMGLASGSLILVAVWYIGLLGLIALCLATLPLIAIWEVCSMINIAVRGRDHAKNSLSRLGTKAGEKLTASAASFRKFYAIFVFFSWVINVGNWIFYSSFLILDGDAYCPSSTRAVSAVLILIPVAVKLPIKALGWYIS